MGGAAAFKDHVLAKLDSNLLNFLETGDFSLETLKKLKAANSKIGHQPGVYLHVIYNPYHPHQVGLYIGSSAALIIRVARHKSERKNLQKAREWKKKQPYRSLHQNFWAKKGYQDFWLRLSDMDRPNNAKEIFDTDVLLNVLEKYLALLFRSPQRQSLRLALPDGVDTDPFRWVGLNVADPLFQPRRSRSDSKTTNSARNTSRRKRRRILFPHRNHSLQNLLFRFADRSKGDRAQIRLKCGVCSGSTHVIDRSPRYEIATGIYLSPSLRCQSSCVSRSLVPFVPFDASIAYKALSTAALAHRTVESRETAKDLTLASRTDVEQTPKLVLEAWIRDQGFACPKSSKKDIVEIADKIRLRLEDPENVDDTELLRPGRPHAARKGRVTVEPRDVANVTDLDGLSFHGLREWIRSQGWTKRLAGLNGAEMLELARRIWNETETVRHEIRSRADLDDMTKANLRTWARSRGWTSNTEVLNKQEVLLLARRIWDDEISFDNTPLHAINQVQSRDDLRRLSRHKLAEWIKSKGYERARSDLSSTERMLNRAHMVWDRLNSAIDDNLNEAEDLKPTQTRPTRTIKDSRVPRTCSDLDEMNAVELETWMHLQGLSVPGSGRTREPLLSLTKKVWAALNNGRPLPEGVKMKRTSPEKRSDIIYMRGESLKLWIKAQNVPIPYRLYHGTENIQSLAEEVWDAIQNGTLLNLRNKLSTGRPDKVKEPQTREDLKKMTSGDLGHWIGCKKVSLGSGSSKATKLSEILTLAETVWDAIKADTLDSLPKRNRAPPNKVKEPTAKDDFKRMTQADIWFWQSSKGVPVKNQDKTKARSIALGERTWDAIQNDTLNELKSDYNARHIQTDAEVAAEAVLTKSGISFDVAGI